MLNRGAIGEDNPNHKTSHASSSRYAPGIRGGVLLILRDVIELVTRGYCYFDSRIIFLSSNYDTLAGRPAVIVENTAERRRHDQEATSGKSNGGGQVAYKFLFHGRRIQGKYTPGN